MFWLCLREPHDVTLTAPCRRAWELPARTIARVRAAAIAPPRRRARPPAAATPPLSGRTRGRWRRPLRREPARAAPAR
eukprot:1379856-Prymnesium_polylepis.2